MRFLIEAEVLTVHVVEDSGHHAGMVQSRIEDLLICCSATLNLHGRKQCVPFSHSGFVNVVETAFGRFGFQVLTSIFDTDVRQRDSQFDRCCRRQQMYTATPTSSPVAFNPLSSIVSSDQVLHVFPGLAELGCEVHFQTTVATREGAEGSSRSGNLLVSGSTWTSHASLRPRPRALPTSITTRGAILRHQIGIDANRRVGLLSFPH